MTFSANFEETLAEARAGHGSALGELFYEVYPRILRYLRAFEPGEAEDLASDAWIDLASTLDTFEGDERGLRGLAITIARRRLIDWQRQRSRQPSVTTEPERIELHGRVGDAEEEAMTGLATEAAIELVGALPGDQAEVVLLRVLGELPVEEVARIVGKMPGTIRVIQHRALRKLAQQLTREGVTK